MRLFDTHCHIHEIGASTDLAGKWAKNGITDAGQVVQAAHEAGVSHMMVVGCTVEDSQLAVAFARQYDNMRASIGIHPHEAARTLQQPAQLAEFSQLAADEAVTAIGECGLDFYYNHSPRAEQVEVLEMQLALAQKHGLPLIFHVRDAFDDFWPIFDEYQDLTGVVHSFTATQKELDAALQRGLYIGLNGIMTFTKDEQQLAAAKQVPLDKLVLETDAPFLTPKPFRGKVNIPAYVRETAVFLADLRHETPEALAAATTANAKRLFGVN